MKISEIDRVLEGISMMQKASGPIDTKLAYALAKNRRSLSVARDIYLETLKGPFDEVLEAWEKDKIDLIRSHAEKDPVGNPVIENGQFRFRAGVDIDAIFAEMKEKHPDFDDAAKARESRFRDTAKIEFDVRIHYIEFAMLPTLINPAALDALMPLIAEDVVPAAEPAAP